MVHIWLPADVHRRLLEALPGWAPAHKALTDATEVVYAVGVRRVSCSMSDAMALLQLAERLYPESVPLIRNAIRKTSTTPSARSHSVPPAPPSRPHRPPLHRLVALSLFVLTFQVLYYVDRSRELLRRLL